MNAIKEYENNKWKVIGQKVGKPAKVRLQFAAVAYGYFHLSVWPQHELDIDVDLSGLRAVRQGTLSGYVMILPFRPHPPRDPTPTHTRQISSALPNSDRLAHLTALRTLAQRFTSIRPFVKSLSGPVHEPRRSHYFTSIPPSLSDVWNPASAAGDRCDTRDHVSVFSLIP